MKPIKLYFAGSFTGSTSKSIEVELGVRNKLCSYVYPNQFTSWLDVSAEVPGNIIIDSGAFSVWKSGKEIDLDAYVDYAKEAIRKGKERNKNVRIVNLDVIPGKVGQSTGLNRNQKKENRAIIDEAAKEGYKNLIKMLRRGVTPIHVFHQGESWKWLNKMIEKTDYIGISPANDMSIPAKKEWIRSVFEYLERNNVKVDTHGFAVWMPTILRDFPWTSCDAATWRLVAAWGCIYYPQGGFQNPDYSKPPLILSVSEKRVGKGLQAATPGKLRILERDGYSYEALQKWERRAEVNIRYFLGLQEWLNKKKARTEFRARTKGFFTPEEI